MKFDFLRLPGNGQKTLDFPNENVVTVRRVLERARDVLSTDVLANNEIAVNGESCSSSQWDSKQVYAGDLVSATGVVKGALHYC